MFLTVGMTLGIRVPVVGPLKDINFQKHSGAPLAALVYIYDNMENDSTLSQELLLSLKHPHVVELLDAFEGSSSMTVVTELLKGAVRMADF